MNRIALVLTVLLVGLCFALPVTVSADVPDPFLVSQSLFFVDCPTAGTYKVEFIVHNVSGIEKTFGVEAWPFYTFPNEGENEWIDPAWVSRVMPLPLALPVDGKMIFTVEYAIPAYAMGKVFKTWIKVFDEPRTVDKPLTVWIRTGDAVPTYQFSVSPSSYRLRVYGTNASVVVDDPNSKTAPPLSIRNESSAKTAFCAQAETPGRDIVISVDSAIAHSADEVGLAFTGLSTEEARTWFSTPFTPESPLQIEGFATGRLIWSLAIPDEVPNGYYSMGIRIAPATPAGGTSVGIEYVVWLLVQVDRTKPASVNLIDTFMHYLWPWGIISLGGFTGVVVVGRVVRIFRKVRRANHKLDGNGSKRQLRKAETG